MEEHCSQNHWGENIHFLAEACIQDEDDVDVDGDSAGDGDGDVDVDSDHYGEER